ncbi:hypothetical protein FIBSPDRAFT_969873 [Athelia psychrophila]|uniref:Peptidase M3A/M3B catalytic domain-containing protein n=1 Tax=Athelia psychrophila TaxID=1759441 RepID=A0A167T401_9AGAM|nr:hypothetical protein FIBSPDRAFT_969873 [Fibularhizoctonia sp. CBS 109695]
MRAVPPTTLLRHRRKCYQTGIENPRSSGNVVALRNEEASFPELIEKIVQSRYVNIGLFNLRQLFFAKFDLKAHRDKEAEDYTEIWNTLRESVSMVKGPQKSIPGQGSFAHTTGGYDAGYYGYIHSQVFSADMYPTVFRVDPLDPALGKRYRDSILKVGGSREELQVSLHKLWTTEHSDM